MTDTLITKFVWGEMEVTIGNQVNRFKDCKIWPAGAREWDWQETGTSHNPGIQPADIEDILTHEIEAFVLGRGMLEDLAVSLETEELLRERKIEYYIEKTDKAVELFNELSQKGVRVGGVFHSTC
ncbi:MAG: Mth938-like domain-containing protein [Anaerolineae bacterium]|nr:Mth938-like domain-containing protein [Anaerolineae bacterium]MDK1079879.1 Mth938-like domain-containing protein [Anaerolineae bacterium]MDK1118192.1 Mth938-like domain-containing protein [Anaerolineae bacterium]